MAETLESRGKKYRRLNRKYLWDAEKLFENKDYSQASEKLWGAAAEMVKTVAAKRGVELGTHTSFWEYVSKPDKEHPELMLKRDFSYAGNLHQNFYEDWLDREYIKEGLQVVNGFLEKLQSIESQKNFCGRKFFPLWDVMSVTIVVEAKGRVLIPARLRKQLGIKPGTELEIDVEKGGIVMRPKRKVSAKDLLGVAGKERVNLEEIESSLGSE